MRASDATSRRGLPTRRTVEQIAGHGNLGGGVRVVWLGMAPRSSPVDVLLKLLEHADASELLVLMKPENILALLRAEGRTDDEVRSALGEEKKLPGELLLGLFERGRTAAELVAILGPEAVAAVEAERKASAAKKAHAPGPSVAVERPSPSHTRAPMAPRDARTEAKPPIFVAGVVLIFLAALAPSMLSILDVSIALALLRVGAVPVLGLVGMTGAIGGALATRAGSRRWVLSLAGALASVGGCLAVMGYGVWMATMGRTSFIRIELIVICLIGMLPAVALAGLFGKARSPVDVSRP